MRRALKTTASEARIERELDMILKHEGWPKYTNRPADRGGSTKGGVTLKALQEWRMQPVTIADLKALQEPEARLLFRDRYLRPWEFVRDDALFAVLVDYAVTSWHDDPTKALQVALGLVVDGKLGPLTRAAVLSVDDPGRLREAVIGYRVRHMVSLALDDSKLRRLIAGHDDLQLENLRGWVNRVTAFLGARP